MHFVKYLSRVSPQKLIKNTSISNQEHFHQHFKQPEHNGMDDGRVTLIDRADNRKELRRPESFWKYKVNTFFSDVLNERNVPAEYE